MNTLRRFLDSRWLVAVVWVAFVFLVVAWMLQARWGSERRELIVHCQARYNAEVVAAIKSRSDAADDRYQAQVDYLKQIDGIPDGDPRRPKLRRAYINQLAASDAKRQAAPLPANPRCG